MTARMQDAIQRLRALPESEQDAFARFVVHELDEDDRWQSTTDAHTEKLRSLVRRTLSENQTGDSGPNGRSPH